MIGVDNDDLIEKFNQWAGQLSSEENFPNWIAINGKTIKSPKKAKLPAVNFSVLKTICLNLFRLLGFLSISENV